MQYSQKYESPLGLMTMISDGEALIGLGFEGKEYLFSSLNQPTDVAALPIFDATRHWLDMYFKGEIPDFTPKIKFFGSDFRQQVWNDLLLMPYGTTTTYGQLAQQAAARMKKAKMSAQAIGGAVGHNPISIIVPCHRVVGTNGKLTGYASGLWRKEKLLNLEAKSLKLPF
ncbi:methylated-DNA--[protein]-cysteine S-methyltransferase [Prevotella disiens]|uniref:methylated-DNA--[protein]-cysteine S-methyltransferase n=3 Tax=Prevotella disiens TaxID=28130 RepID=A0A096APN7_9BACT|nr:methylated-DNA--[protein]-cysteine S-methyltransferase [Prevotella disiens]EFL46593.1 6-O-methylguanine DNA methyltransferase, DNA binding domain protein [Prevotella disiens FB035-09AN]KGF49043.1 6-O-methylguanine DNA methyltransferase [Prevotella disiens DNF00882]RGL03614.1 methylated-DNA--[protein]-cysteine S-methyltransferase [Prevotella disiens]